MLSGLETIRVAPRRILAVGDHRANLLAIESALEPLGYAVVCASSGKEALAHLLNDEFSLIVLDVMMPELDGFETAKMIRAREKTSHLPIIFITARGDDADYSRSAYELEAIDFIPRPFEASVLRAKAGGIIRLQDQLQVAANALALDHVRSVLRDELLQREADVFHELDRQANAVSRILGHELRNPLAPLRSAVDLMSLMPVDPSVRALAEVMERNINTLVRLVDELLVVASPEQLELDREVVDLRYVVRMAVEATEGRFEDREHDLSVIPFQRPVLVEGDAARLIRALAVIVDNAALFTPARGHVEVRCKTSAREAVIAVIDDGIGLSKEDLRRVFKMFVIERARRDGSGGLGLGLALAQRIVAAHGGTIAAFSEGLQMGCVFELRLPLRPSLA